MNTVIKNIPFISEEEIRKEIEKVKSQHGNFACFPNHNVKQEIIQKLEKEGFRTDFTSIGSGFYIIWD